MLSCHAGGPGSIPGRCKLLLYLYFWFKNKISGFEDEQISKSFDGVMVSIAAFQAVVPGSIPGRRM